MAVCGHRARRDRAHPHRAVRPQNPPVDRPMTGERRTAARVRFSGGVLPPAAWVHPGRDVIVVDLSRTGALVEGVWRFRPGARVDLQLELDAAYAAVRGRIERCY